FMNPATEPRSSREAARLLIIDRLQRTFKDSQAAFLTGAFNPGDLLVVNDAATLPASFFAHDPSGVPVEIRLIHHRGGAEWEAVLLGPGDWRTPTEFRASPEPVGGGDVLGISYSFFARVLELKTASNPLAVLRFSREGAAMWAGI